MKNCSCPKWLVKKLRREENFTVDSTEIAPVAGKAAILLSGRFRGSGRLWQRQVWILAQPGRFLIISITGPAGMKEQLEKICDAVLGTLRLIDPADALEARKKNIESGRKFLASLTDKKLAAAVEARPKWYLLRLKSDIVGFMKVVEAVTRRKKAKGVEIRKWVVLKFPKDKVRLMGQVLFTTADRSLELWTKRLQVGLDDKVARLSEREKGIKQNELIVCTVSKGDQERMKKKKVLESIYLPLAMADLLGRLVDLTSPGAYSFASYTSKVNEFDMQTFRVVGKDRISYAGKRIDAVRVTQQMSADTEPVTLWLDEKGGLLRMETEEGLVMEPTSRQGVLRRFPNAERSMRVLDNLLRSR